MKTKVISLLWIVLLFPGFFPSFAGNVFYVGSSSKVEYYPTDFSPTPQGGDTIKILAERTTRLMFTNFNGFDGDPIVIINSGGKVALSGTSAYMAFSLNNCNHVKITGRGDSSYYYGFRFVKSSFGLSFNNLCSHCEAEFVEIDSCALGVHAKRDYGGNPPSPYPVFSHLAIHDCRVDQCSVGMYIGETKSPGMLFKHLRVYNNVVTNTGRESIQIANCVDDIEVYNNFCKNAGQDSIYGQTNVFQLGGNSIGRIYNNIFLDAPSFGAMILGVGDMNFVNNYFEGNQGVFSDTRYLPVANSPLRIDGNKFKDIKGTEVLRLYNAVNDCCASNNICNNSSLPYLNKGRLPSSMIEYNNNAYSTIETLSYNLDSGIFRLDSVCESIYSGLGPVKGLTHVYNVTPVLDSIPDMIVNIGDSISFPIHASVEDGDSLIFFAKNLPSFVSIIPGGNGDAYVVVNGIGQSKGVYSTVINVKDKSHEGIGRQVVRIAVKDSLNRPVEMGLPSTLSVEAVTKSTFRIPAFDPDNDSIRYTITGRPYFISYVTVKDSAYFKLNPTNINVGTYPIMIKAEDGFGESVIDTMQLIISPVKLYPGRLIYRVNYGNGLVEDAPINWQADYGNSSSYEANYSMGTGSASWSGVNNTGVPNNVFGPFRHNGVGMNSMLFSYPCESGKYQVNLLFAQRSSEVVNDFIETFSVHLEDSLMDDSVCIYNEAGYTALKKSYIVDVRDNAISLKLTKILNDTKLNGVEIKYLEAINTPPVILDIPSMSMKEGDTLSVFTTFTDDGFNGSDTITFNVDEMPSFITFNRNGKTLSFHCAPGYVDSGEYSIPVYVSDGELTTTKRFNLTVSDYHINPPVLSNVNKTTIIEGVTDTLTFTYSDPDNDVMTLTLLQKPSFGTFSTVSNGIGRIILAPGYSSAGNYMIQVKARDSFGFESIDTINLVVSMGNEVVRIPLDASMITNLIPNTYPQYWVDEQSVDPVLNQHPKSGSWQANPKYLPSEFYLDLGARYVVKKMFFHDMHNVGTFFASIGEPGDWSEIFSLYTNFFNSWRLVNTDISTRYLKFSIRDGYCPQVNELAIYGYPDLNISASYNNKEAFRIRGAFQINEDSLKQVTKIYPTLVVNELNISSSEQKVITKIYNIQGGLVLESSDRLISMDKLNKGIYMVIVNKPSGEILVCSRICKK